MVLKRIRNKIKEIRLMRQWRLKNPHNYTTMMHSFDINCVEVGRYTYGALTVYTFNNDNKLRIGNFCSIGPYVQFILSADHNTKTISSYPFKTKVLNLGKEGLSKGDIVIDDDVWLGANVIVLSGVHVGRGAIVAAGAVVDRDISPYSICGGVPAREIKKRFSDKVIGKLMKIDYDHLDKGTIRQKMTHLYTPLNDQNVDELIEGLTKEEGKTDNI